MKRIAFLLLLGASAFAQDRATEYPQFNQGDKTPKDKGIEWVQAIKVLSPAVGAEIKGSVKVEFEAPGMGVANALCWQQPTTQLPDKWGHDVEVARDVKLGEDGKGSFVFPADQFPHGPLIVRLYARDAGKKQDLFQLQLFNQGGVAWNHGIPKTDPPAAAGMKLAFADDFNKALSISRKGEGTTYQSHKPGGGDFSGYLFSDMQGANNPFSQVETWMRIHAARPAGTKGSTGIISSAHEDKSGFYASAPCYFECRLIAQSAPGTWPAFWVMSRNSLDKPNPLGTDELDILEAYGGVGKGNPNYPGYSVTSHFWAQKAPDGSKLKGFNFSVPILELGGKSSWSTTFHTYALKITEEETTYYFDDLKVFTHPTSTLSKSQPMYFLINYAIGGISGWKTDLTRYGGESDMWVDFVRVYQGEKK